jgi:acyl dehydratase
MDVVLQGWVCNMIDFDDVKIGDVYEYEFDYTESVHYDFMQLSGDDSRIHTSQSFARKNGFKNVLGYAFVLTSFLSKIYGTKFPGGNELCLKQECSFRNPFYIGDKIMFCIEVISKTDGLDVIEITNSAETDKGILVFTGKAALKLSLYSHT